MAIVVEIDEHIAPHTVPLTDTVGPPPQIVVRVRSAVQVMLVGAVQPHIHEAGCRPEDTRQSGAAHHTVAGTVLLQQLKHRLLMPAGVPELDGDVEPGGHLGEEVLQPRVVNGSCWRELNQQHPTPPVRALHKLFSSPEDIALCVSRAVCRNAQEGYNVQPDRLRVVHNGIRLELFNRADAQLAASQITTLFLTGGSTAVPLLKQTVLAMFPSATVVEGDMFGSVGLGLALDARRKYGA